MQVAVTPNPGRLAGQIRVREFWVRHLHDPNYIAKIERRLPAEVEARIMSWLIERDHGNIVSNTFKKMSGGNLPRELDVEIGEERVAHLQSVYVIKLPNQRASFALKLASGAGKGIPRQLAQFRCDTQFEYSAIRTFGAALPNIFAPVYAQSSLEFGAQVFSLYTQEYLPSRFTPIKNIGNHPSRLEGFGEQGYQPLTEERSAAIATAALSQQVQVFIHSCQRGDLDYFPRIQYSSADVLADISGDREVEVRWTGCGASVRVDNSSLERGLIPGLRYLAQQRILPADKDYQAATYSLHLGSRALYVEAVANGLDAAGMRNCLGENYLGQIFDSVAIAA